MKNQIIIVLGKKGSGKTYLMRRLIADKLRVVIYDPLRQFPGSGVIIAQPVPLIEYLKARGPGEFKAVYQPDFSARDDKDIIQREFKTVCRIVDCLSDVYFVIDEIDLYTSHSACPAYFNNFIQRGRHKRISLAVTTRRHTETTRHLTAQADILISFHQHEPNDIKYLGGFFGSLAQDLPRLPPYHYIKYDNGTVTKEKPIG